MLKFLLGVIVGIAFATVGVSGLVRMVDKGVAEVQKAAKDIAK